MNNSTETVFSETHAEYYFKTVSVLCGCILVVVFLCSLMLSTSVLWALSKTRQLQSPVYRMVGYILLDEILVRIFGSTLIFTSMLAGSWLHGDFGCVFYAFWMTWLGVTATSLFTCVAVERYIIICRADSIHTISHKVVDIVALLCYIHGLVWASLPLLGVNQYVYEPSGVSCTPNWKPEEAGYILGLFAVCFLMPVTVSVICYSAIVLTVRRSRRRAAVTRQNASSEKGVAFTVVLTMTAFLFSWTPYCTLGLLNTLGFAEQIQLAKEVTLIPLVTAKTAGLWNPLIFTFNNKEVRGTITATFYRIRENMSSAAICTRRNKVLSGNERRVQKSVIDHNNHVNTEPREYTSPLFIAANAKGRQTIETEV